MVIPISIIAPWLYPVLPSLFFGALITALRRYPGNWSNREWLTWSVLCYIPAGVVAATGLGLIVWT
jgi:hypothetical protein